jgi:AbrB family looped-hinge helix DNA binding protein
MGKDSVANKEFKATVTSKGQITLPAGLRKFWDLKPGDQVSLGHLGEKEGRIRPLRRRSIFELLDELPPLSLGRPLTQADIEDSIAEAMAEKEMRSRDASRR